jgi:hypothetical protein
MRRTPPWVFVAAVGVMLAGLSLCVWAMEQSVEAEEASTEPPPPSPPEGSASREALAPPHEPAATPMPEPARHPEPARRPDAPASERPEASAAAPSAQPRPAPEPAADPARAAEPAAEPAHATEPDVPGPAAEPRHEAPPGPAVVRASRVPDRFDFAPSPLESNGVSRRFESPHLDAPPSEPPRPKPAPAVVRVQSPSPEAPMFGAPPARARDPLGDGRDLPAFITELSDATTQVVRGAAGDGVFAFGFYADGNIRFSDVDGGRYAGMAESARARMREVDGTRAFTVQIGVAADGRLQATFTGGPHDAQTIALEPLVGWSAA